MMTNQECNIKMIPPYQLEIDGNIRLTMDEDILKELADSMKAHGLLQPIGVAKAKNGKYQVIFGHRRLAAAKLLGWTEIPAIICDSEDYTITTLVENLQRDDLNPAELGLALRSLADSGDCTQVDIARMLGKAESWVSRVVKLGQIIKQYQESGLPAPKVKLPGLSICFELLNYPDLLINAADAGWTLRTARNKVKKLQGLVDMDNGSRGHRRKSIAKPKATTRSLSNHQDLSSYVAIHSFEDGFEIKPFLYTQDLEMDVEAVIEKLTEFRDGCEREIELLRHHQRLQSHEPDEQGLARIDDAFEKFSMIPHSTGSVAVKERSA